MSIVLKKMALPKESKLWLFECGECHSEFLLKEDDFIIGYPLDAPPLYECNCPVCGESSGILDTDWVKKGNIKDIRKNDFERRISVTDYDGQVTVYNFDSDAALYYDATSQIGNEVFEHYRLKRFYAKQEKQDD